MMSKRAALRVRHLHWLACACFGALLALVPLPSSALSQSQFASSWAVNSDADWVPYPSHANGAQPLGAPNDACATSSIPGAWADWAFHAFSIPGGEVITGIELRIKYYASFANTAQLELGGALVGATRSIPLYNSGMNNCANTVWRSAGGAGDVWGTALTAADFNAGNVRVRFTNDSPTVDLDSVELIVYYGNSPPTAEAGGPYNVGEGGSVGLDGTGSSDPDQAGNTLTYVWDLDADMVFGEAGETGSTPTFSAAGLDGPTSRVVTLRVTDSDGASDEDTATVNVSNVPPTVATPAVVPKPSNEGQSVTASATFVDPGPDTFTCTVNYGDGPAVAGSVAGNTCNGPAHTYADNGGYTVEVSVIDKDGGTGSASSIHIVDNVAPTITASTSSAEDCGDTPENGLVEVSADFSDPGFDSAVAGTVEDFDDSTIDWGDGTVEPATVSETPGSAGTPTTGTIAGSHTYAGGGIFTVTLTVADDDGGTDSVSVDVMVTGAGLNGGQLQVVGTDFKDVVDLQRKGSQVEVQAGFLGKPGKAAFPAIAVSSVRVAVCDGDDQVHVNHDVTVPAALDGGGGRDHLRAGDGPTVLDGGADDDVLEGGAAADLISGGEGNDVLHGRGGNDAIFGDAGDDGLFGNAGDDSLDGGPGFDDCHGAPGNDTIGACEP